jgi:glucose-6-phosphate dehydrogenase assembly protein OpcA
MRLVEAAQSEAKERVVLCDLNWTRLVHVRIALAQFFDHPTSQRHLREIKRIEINFASGYRSTAILLAGWIGAQLQWETEPKENGTHFTFRDQSGATIEIRLEEKSGEPIGRCVLRCKGTEFRVVHSPGGDLLDVSAGSGGEKRMHQLMPATLNDAVELVSEELMRGGPHQVYLRAVNCVRELF